MGVAVVALVILVVSLVGEPSNERDNGLFIGKIPPLHLTSNFGLDFLLNIYLAFNMNVKLEPTLIFNVKLELDLMLNV